jgi:hypothetical protein
VVVCIAQAVVALALQLVDKVLPVGQDWPVVPVQAVEVEAQLPQE